MTLEEHVATAPMWVQWWITWMAIVNLAAILFLAQWRDGGLRLGFIEAFVILAVLPPIVIFMEWLFAQTGYTRLLGLAHIVFWGPLAIWLWTRLDRHPWETIFGKYLRVFLATIGISLAFDVTDVVRYLLGDGALT